MPIVSQLADCGKAGDSDKTFIFENESHTLGNALKYIIASYPDVEYCGYTISHPAEAKIHLRIQMHKGRAVDALRRGLEDLGKICDHTITKFEEEISTYKMAHNVT